MNKKINLRDIYYGWLLGWDSPLWRFFQIIRLMSLTLSHENIYVMRTKLDQCQGVRNDKLLISQWLNVDLYCTPKNNIQPLKLTPLQKIYILFTDGSTWVDEAWDKSHFSPTMGKIHGTMMQYDVIVVFIKYTIQKSLQPQFYL